LAPVGDEFTGPVLLEGQASAEFVAETLVPLMLARRPADSDNPRFAQAQGTPFLRRIGLRVLSDAFSISDTPSLSEYGGRPVPGAYQVDDEGVQPRDVNLVDKGRLLTLLTSRTPQKNLLQSNGHNRTGVQAGVIQMQSAQAVPASELKSKYLDLLRAQDKTFGYIVRGIANPNEIAVGSGPGGPFILQAIKVTLDGKEQSVRGLRFGAVTPAAFRDLAEASQERTLYSYRGGAAVAVSVIVPNLMFEELEIQRVTDVLQKPPIVPSPPRE
jgi:predicted Zn-dependent protease